MMSSREHQKGNRENGTTERGLKLYVPEERMEILRLIRDVITGRGFGYWLAVEDYEKDKEIRHALEWVLGRPNYRALLKTFVENDHSSVSEASENIRRTLLACISKAEHGGQLTTDDLPDYKAGSAAQVAISAWLRNACRRDLSTMPESPEEVVPISYHCGGTTGEVIAATYRALGLSAEDTYRLSHLKDFAIQAKLKTWGEISPLVVGFGLASCGVPLSFAAALLLPGIGTSFFYDRSLGGGKRAEIEDHSR